LHFDGIDWAVIRSGPNPLSYSDVPMLKSVIQVSAVTLSKYNIKIGKELELQRREWARLAANFFGIV
jgi:hypothetical protein